MINVWIKSEITEDRDLKIADAKNLSHKFVLRANSLNVLLLLFETFWFFRAVLRVLALVICYLPVHRNEIICKLRDLSRNKSTMTFTILLLSICMRPVDNIDKMRDDFFFVDFKKKKKTVWIILVDFTVHPVVWNTRPRILSGIYPVHLENDQNTTWILTATWMGMDCWQMYFWLQNA